MVPAERGAAATLGGPDGLGQTVTDAAASAHAIAAATGTQFSAPATLVVRVRLAGQAETTRVSLTRLVSTCGGPRVEFDQAAPAVGPWAAGPDHAMPYLSYSVGDVDDTVQNLQRAGWHLQAKADGTLAYLTAGGLTARVINAKLAPAGAGTNQSPAPIDFGAPIAGAIFPCNIPAAQAALTKGMGITWRAPQVFSLTWQLADGSTVEHTATGTISQQGPPYPTTEEPHGFPGEDPCNATYTPHYLVFVAPGGDVAAADAQMQAAGLRFIARALAPDGSELIAAYRGPGGASVEAVSPVFMPAS